MPHLVLYLALPFLTLAIYRLLRFYRNYRAAALIGLPTLISPVSPLDIAWLITKDILTPLLISPYCPLPRSLTSWTSRSYIGWNFPDYHATHAKLHSDAFLIVTPSELELYVADPAAADDILARQHRDFIKSPAMYDLLEVFGRNVNTTNGSVWARHRRITAPPFNERISGVVWTEALRQAGEMKDVWREAGAEGVRSTPADAMMLALHVLTAAGFGVNYSFSEEAEAELQTQRGQKTGKSGLAPGHTLSYRAALSLIIRNMGLVILLRIAQAMHVPGFLFPAKLSSIATAVAEFKTYLVDMVADERAHDGEEKGNLMSVLLRSSELAKSSSEAADEDGLEPANRSGLSDDEVIGNLFIYNLAGHDTTANTIAFAITLLSVHPEWQEWMGEEVDEVFGEEGKEGEIDGWDYEACFPRLRRCLAVMLETLRLYGPVAAIPRYTASSSQPITLPGGHTYLIPPNTNVYINLCALHTHPDHWGPDPHVWRPDRWITSSGEILTPTPGSFSPWAGGPRACVGKKFSQVEFVAVLATLMQGGSRVEVVRERSGESRESATQAKRRAMRVVDESRVEFTLKMVRPERVGLRWAHGRGKDGKTGE